MRDTGYGIRDAGYEMRDSGYAWRGEMPRDAAGAVKSGFYRAVKVLTTCLIINHLVI